MTIIRLLIVMIVIAQSAVVSMAQDSYTSLMKRADTEYVAGDYVSALQDSQAAAALDSNGYLAHYYMGLIYLKLDHPKESLREATSAIASAPEAAKPSAQELLRLASAMNVASARKTLAEGDAAAGLIAKAAREYADSYDAYPRWAKLGFKGVDLYTTLDDTADAGTLLRKISTNEDTTVSKEASRQLVAISGRLASIAASENQEADSLVAGRKLWSASSEEVEVAAKRYEKSIKASPECQKTGHFMCFEKVDHCAWLPAARLRAFAGDKDGAESYIRQGLPWHLTVDENSFRYDNPDSGACGGSVFDKAWLKLVCDPTFVQFLQDASGDEAADAAKSTCSKNSQASSH